MRSWLRDHGLLVVNLALFVVSARSCPCSVTWGPASSWR